MISLPFAVDYEVYLAWPADDKSVSTHELITILESDAQDVMYDSVDAGGVLMRTVALVGTAYPQDLRTRVKQIKDRWNFNVVDCTWRPPNWLFDLIEWVSFESLRVWFDDLTERISAWLFAEDEDDANSHSAKDQE